MYFNSFPDIIYDPNRNGDYQICKNLLRRVAVREKVRTNTLLYDTYDVREGESPESIADKLYGDSEYHWIILMLNNITDRYHDWPLSTPQFLDYVNDKYDNASGIHHYEIAQTSGDTTIKIDIGTDNTDYPSATPITNLEHEESEQDRKRKIRLLDDSYLEQITDEFEKLIGQSVL